MGSWEESVASRVKLDPPSFETQGTRYNKVSKFCFLADVCVVLDMEDGHMSLENFQNGNKDATRLFGRLFGIIGPGCLALALAANLGSATELHPSF